MTRLIRLAAVALLTAATAFAAPVPKDEYANAVIIDNVPFVEQKSEYCGPAALTSVFRFYRVAADQDLIAEIVYDERFRGSLITDMNHYAKSRGFRTTLAKGTPEKLKELIDAGIPVIAFLDEGLWFLTKPHYVVVFGYTPSGFIMHDGYEPAAFMPYHEFERKWNEQGSPFLAIYP